MTLHHIVNKESSRIVESFISIEDAKSQILDEENLSGFYDTAFYKIVSSPLSYDDIRKCKAYLLDYKELQELENKVNYPTFSSGEYTKELERKLFYDIKYYKECLEKDFEEIALTHNLTIDKLRHILSELGLK